MFHESFREVTKLSGGSVFAGIFVPDEVRFAVSGEAWVAAMLEAEAALAVALGEAGIISPDAADGISSIARELVLDPEEIAASGRAAGNPVPPLVRELTAAVPKEASGYVHFGATSQDIVDTAAMMVCRDVMDVILSELDRLAAACAELALRHRETVMAGRTLLQQALPTTFGLKAAGWLVSVVEARERLRYVRRERLAAQLGGAAGTLASLGDSGPEVVKLFAQELGLREPVLPWHTDRTRMSEIGAALSLVCGVVGKVSADVILLSQTEVGEVAEPAAEGRGGSSTLPHKRNPVVCVTARASSRRGRMYAAALADAMDHEHERAAGAWHTEWENLSGALACTGGAVAGIREALEGLEVYPERMRENLDLTGGLLLSENLTTLAAVKLGRLAAHEKVAAVCRRVADGGGDLTEEVLADPELGEVLSEEEVRDALRPENYLGSAQVFVDRALTMYEESTEEERA